MIGIPDQRIVGARVAAVDITVGHAAAAIIFVNQRVPIVKESGQAGIAVRLVQPAEWIVAQLHVGGSGRRDEPVLDIVEVGGAVARVLLTSSASSASRSFSHSIFTT